MAVSDVLPVNPSFVVPERLLHHVLVSDFDSGQEQRKQKWANPKRSWKLRTEAMTNAELDSLRSFWLARNGPYDPFSFLPPTNHDRLLTGLACGTGNGTQTVFTLGNSSTPPYYYRVYTGAGTRNQASVNGAPVSGTFTNNDGSKLSTVTITPAPATGAVVTADIDRYLIARFAQNDISLTLEHYGIGSAEYELVEVLWASI